MSDLGGSEGWWWGMLWIFPYLSTDIISNISAPLSVPALNQNINETSVHSPYVRQALSLLSLAWITPWNGWEVFSLTWKKRNVNIKLNSSFLSNSPSWSPGCRWPSRWGRARSQVPGTGQTPETLLRFRGMLWVTMVFILLIILVLRSKWLQSRQWIDTECW